MNHMRLTLALAVVLVTVCAAGALGSPMTANSLLDPLSSLRDAAQPTWEKYTAIGATGEENPANARIAEQYGKLPLSFVENRGQLDSAVRYVIRGPQASAFFTDNGVTFDLSEPLPRDAERATRARGLRLDPRELTARAAVARKCAALRMEFEGADPNCRVEGVDELPGKVNYFTGSDSAKWHTDIPTFKGVIYRGVWQGVDVSYHGDRRQLKYDIRVAAGADVSQIRLRYEGAENLWLDDSGDLHVQTAVTTFVEKVPGIYQENGGGKQPLRGGYVLLDDHTVGFRVEGRNPDLPLVIDPASDLVYSTFLGGTQHDYANWIAIDSSGCAYVAGCTYSSDFPTTPGAFDRTYDGGSSYNDAFVTKLNATGSALVYSTYLGGSGEDGAYSIAIDSSGCAYVAGGTSSSDFPTTPGAFQRTYGGGGGDYSGDAFVTKLNASGSALLYSTFLGGNNDDCANSIAVDSSDCAYVAGYTTSSDFPTTPGAFQRTYGGGDYDAFVTKLNASGSALVYSTYLGGSDYEWYGSITIDSSGCAYVAGYTDSSDFPTTPGAFQRTFGGYGDAFVAKLSPSGSALVYSTYLGGSDYEWYASITIDSSGCAYVAGGTYSTNFPTTPGAFQRTFGGYGDAFVAKLSPSGSALIYSTYLGGSDQDGASIATHSSGCAYVAGYTYSSNFPTTPGAFQRTLGWDDAFITKLSCAAYGPSYSNSLRVAAYADRSYAHLYQAITLTCAYCNTGPSSVASAALYITLPSGCTFASASDNALSDPTRGTILWDLGTVPADGVNRTRSVTVTVNTDCIFPSILSFAFSFSGAGLPIGSNTVVVRTTDAKTALVDAIERLRVNLCDTIMHNPGDSYIGNYAQMLSDISDYQADLSTQLAYAADLVPPPDIFGAANGLQKWLDKAPDAQKLAAWAGFAYKVAGLQSMLVDVNDIKNMVTLGAFGPEEGMELVGNRLDYYVLTSDYLMGPYYSWTQTEDIIKETTQETEDRVRNGLPADFDANGLIGEIDEFGRKLKRTGRAEIRVQVPGKKASALLGSLSQQAKAMKTAIAEARVDSARKYFNAGVNLGVWTVKGAAALLSGGTSGGWEIAMNAVGTAKGVYDIAQGAITTYQAVIGVRSVDRATALVSQGCNTLQNNVLTALIMYGSELNRVDGLVAQAAAPGTQAMRQVQSSGGLQIVSTSFPSSVCTFDAYESGACTQSATVTVVNSGSSVLQAGVSYEFYVSGQSEPIAVLAPPEVTIQPGNTVPLNISYSLPPISTYGGTALFYRALITATDGTNSVHSWTQPFVVASSNGQLASLQSTSGSTVLSGTLPTCVTEESEFTCGATTKLVEFMLYHDAGDVDLHVFDSAGVEVGFDPVAGETRNGIPGARYSGNSTNPETIVMPTVPGATYRVLATCVDADLPADYMVFATEVPSRPAVLDTSTPSLSLRCCSTLSDSAALDFAEIGGEVGVNNLHVAVSDLAGPAGFTVPTGQVTVSAPPASIPPASGGEVILAVSITRDTPAGSYTGTATIWGTDAVSGQQLSVTVPVTLEVTAFGIGQAKGNSPGTMVALPTAVITAGTERFGDRFYVEDTNRTSGILVLCGSGHTYETGHSVSITGPINITDSGEVAITDPTVEVVDYASVPAPLGMRNTLLGGGSAVGIQQGITGAFGLNNIGLLVRTWGKVTLAGRGWFYLDDGSGVSDGSGVIGIYVDAPGMSVPSKGSYVAVTGISSCDLYFGNVVSTLLPRSQDDIETIEGYTATVMRAAVSGDGTRPRDRAKPPSSSSR